MEFLAMILPILLSVYLITYKSNVVPIADIILLLLIFPIHEIGHFLVGRIIKLKNTKLVFSFFEAGISYEIEDNQMDPIDAFMFFIAGIIFNLILLITVTLTTLLLTHVNLYYSSLLTICYILTALRPTSFGSDGYYITTIFCNGNPTNFRKCIFLFFIFAMTSAISITSFFNFNYTIKSLGIIILGIFYYFTIFHFDYENIDTSLLKTATTSKQKVLISKVLIMYAVLFLLTILVIKYLNISKIVF
jgi:hypothetical protein